MFANCEYCIVVEIKILPATNYKPTRYSIVTKEFPRKIYSYDVGGERERVALATQYMRELFPNRNYVATCVGESVGGWVVCFQLGG